MSSPAQNSLKTPYLLITELILLKNSFVKTFSPSVIFFGNAVLGR